MPNASIEAKLLLKPEEHVFVVNPPKAEPLPFQQTTKTMDIADAVVVYAIKQSDLPSHLEKVKDVPPEARLWICYPKAGKLGTDLGRDSLWQWMREKGYDGVRLVSVDDTWSAFWFKR